MILTEQFIEWTTRKNKGSNFSLQGIFPNPEIICWRRNNHKKRFCDARAWNVWNTLQTSNCYPTLVHRVFSQPQPENEFQNRCKAGSGASAPRPSAVNAFLSVLVLFVQGCRLEPLLPQCSWLVVAEGIWTRGSTAGNMPGILCCHGNSPTHRQCCPYRINSADFLFLLNTEQISKPEKYCRH